MDTSDVEIRFDAAGVCSHCHEFDVTAKTTWFPNEQGERLLAQMIESCKLEGRGKAYDCVIGLSGGADSSYLALKVKQWGLRPLVVHVDAGWNSELAVSNIERVVKKLGYDLHTIVIDWEEIRDLQVAYLKAGVPNQDTVQDHAFFAALVKCAKQFGIKTALSGGNFATESVLPRSWQGSAMDAQNLLAIHKQFGKASLKQYPTVGLFDYYVWNPFVYKLKLARPLNLMRYDKPEAMKELEQELGWRAYDRKHGESRFTKVFQNDFLPRRFGYDKRRAHLSSVVLAGQLSRAEAMAELSKPLYDETERANDIAFLCKKLRITPAEYESFITAPLKTHRDYPNWESKRALLAKARDLVERITGKRLAGYSRDVQAAAKT
jgi:aminotransferase